MGHLMNTEYVYWNGRSYKIKGRDKVEIDRIMSNYRPLPPVAVPSPEKPVPSGVMKTPTPAPVKPKAKAKAKKSKK